MDDDVKWNCQLVMKQSVTCVLLGLSLLQIQTFGKSATLPNILKPRNGDPFDTIPKNFWQEFSSPFTDPPEEEEKEVEDFAEATTQDPYPYFEEPTNSVNLTTQLGDHVHLHCRVNDLNGKTVSWVRRKGDDLHLLSFGQHTYSSDSRYLLEYLAPNNWRLLIQYANERDEGTYSCEVNSQPPLMHVTYLSVVVPRVEIVDERGLSTPDKYYKAGSTIDLKCVISNVPHPTSYVTWKHGERMLNYDTRRGGISVKTDLQPGGAISRLYIANANRRDSGNFTCALAEVTQATVLVHVLNGENPAAMQHGGCARWTPLAGALLLTLLPHLLTRQR